MIICHAVESFGSGIVEFLRLLTLHQKHNFHYIIYNEREILIKDIKPHFKNNVLFIEWKNAQREINVFADVKAYFELKGILHDIGEFDVLHLHSSKAGIIGRLLSIKQKVFYTPNGCSFARTDISRMKRSIYQLLEILANKRSGQVIAVSNSESSAYRAIGIQSHVVNNGITIKESSFCAKNDTEKLRIVTVGRISTQKNPTLFAQIASYYESDEDLEFIWIGDGDEDSKRFLKATNITVTGWKTKEEVEHKLINSSIYLSTALWEGLPFAVLEAMNLGLPLVLNSCIGNVDLVAHGINGYLFDSLDGAIKYINEYRQNKELLNEHGRNSILKVQREFNAQQMANAYQIIYQKGLPHE
jgi:glycosyltransferase involved in cell wall biosynthesis